VTHSAGVDGDTNRIRTRFGTLALDELEGAVGAEIWATRMVGEPYAPEGGEATSNPTSTALDYESRGPPRLEICRKHGSAARSLSGDAAADL
jgi:hypothetical protein